MDLTEIKRLVRLVESSAISELEITQEGFQIRIQKSSPSQLVQPFAVHPAAPPPHAFPHVPKEAPVKEVHAVEPGASSSDLLEIRSPMVGTFYRAPAPDASPYINIGDQITPGQVLCIVEAMKLMNEIEAEITGKVVKILVENAQPVEFNQPLFLVEKT